jgi:hypothetical protein
VQGKFVLLANNTVGFQLGSYDHSRELVIDPRLAYSTYLGGSGNAEVGTGDYGSGIAVDNEGNAYVVGTTWSLDYPVTSGAFQTIRTTSDFTGFVTKINPTGTALVYSTYLGGNNSGGAQYVAADSAGYAYVVGVTGSRDFPITSGAFQTSFEKGNPFQAPFITKLNPAGNALVYSTFLGGGNVDYHDRVDGIALNATGDAYVVGTTASDIFPVTPGAFQPMREAKSISCFVSRLNSTGTALIYSTFLQGRAPGGTNLCTGIAVDGYDKAYVTGYTDSKAFPVTPGAFQQVNNSQVPVKNKANRQNAFVTKFYPSGTLAYSTYLGGSVTDQSYGIALDSARNAYVFGQTESPDFPVTSGAYDTALNVMADFVTKLDPTGSSLVYSTFFDQLTTSIAVDASGHVFLTGVTFPGGLPITPDAAQPVANESQSAFLTELSIDGSALGYSTYFGGENYDGGTAVAIDTAGNAYLLGSTTSEDLKVTPGAYQSTYKGVFSLMAEMRGWTPNDFVAKFSFSDAAYTSTQISTTNSSEPSGTAVTFTATVAPVSGTWTPTGDVSFRIDGAPYIHVTLDSSGHASYSTDTLTAGQHTITAAYLGTPHYHLAPDGYAPSSASLLQTITAE